VAPRGSVSEYRGVSFTLVFNRLPGHLRQYAAGAGDLCSVAHADAGRESLQTLRRAFAIAGARRHGVRMAQMAALTFNDCNCPEKSPKRGALLRLLDTLAEWQMRHSHRVISRVQNDAAAISNVVQPSSLNDRSSTKP
jgi:hypothetical protein